MPKSDIETEIERETEYGPQKYDEGMTFLQNEIISLMRQGYDSTSEIANLVNCKPDWVRKTRRRYNALIEQHDPGQDIENRIKVNAALQKARDKSRVERKAFREEIRYYNSTTELFEEIGQVLTEYHSDFDTIIHEDPETEVEGILQISDIHFNELIDLPFNQFDFKIAAKRLKKYVQRCKKVLDGHGVTNVHICFTGDMINSDRRLDEVMNAATNRAKATVLAALILKQVILDLNKEYNLKIYMVTGNESRMHKEMGSSEIRQTDNYDMIIHEMLKMIFDGKEGVEFIDGSPIEQPIKVMGHGILLVHGHQIKMSGVSSQVQRLKGKWSDYLTQTRELGSVNTIDYVMFGHFHTARITDLFARSGGLCGANAYSDNQLQLSSRASQNMFIVDEDGIHGMKIDLQHYQKYSGYGVDELLETYNARSASRVKWLRPKKI